MILLDSGFFFSIRVKNDTKHAIAKKILKGTNWASLGAIVTNNLVVNETYTLVNMRTKANLEIIGSLHSLFWGNDKFFQVIYHDDSESQDIEKILVKYSSIDRIISYVDASLIYLAGKFDEVSIISSDSHFDGIINRIKI
jgi:predicted nucleic acid-binding protein